MGDCWRLRQVLLNLVGNAIKFTERGEVALKVGLVRSLPSGVKLHFAVRDTGIGISQEKVQRLFRPFEQADPSMTRKYGGTGLGLAISARIAELMTGEMWVESAVGGGSTFHFTAVLARGEAAAARVTHTVIPELAGGHVLIIHDNVTNRHILEETVRRLQMTPEVAESGAAGLFRLEEASTSDKPFRVILLDELMPGMSGFELIQRAGARAEVCASTIMMLTASEQSTGIAKCRELGVSSYLTKPIKPRELLAAMGRIVGRAPVEAVPEPLPPANRNHEYPLRILLAEDSAVNQKSAVVLLEKMGHSVSLARNGAEAVTMHGKDQFDLIFMDVQMPEMDGFEATRHIRRLEQKTGSHIPIVAMTAHAMSGDRQRCLDAGMDDYVSKPISRKVLEQAIAGSSSLRRASGFSHPWS